MMEKGLKYSGYCERCGTVHCLMAGDSILHGQELFSVLEKTGTLVQGDENPLYSTENLFNSARGQMFGVMACIDAHGSEKILRAFSGQYNGLWEVPGWVSPVLDCRAFYDITSPADRKIKDLGRLMADEKDSVKRSQLSLERRNMSRRLMEETHSLYVLRNFRGDEMFLRDVYRRGKGIPTGTADCCGPKLLNHAARNGLRPTGMCEFYFGKENLSGTREHGRFYSSCIEKCEPILGFMLCGLDSI